MSTWGGFDSSITANRYQQMFLQGYLDISGNLIVRNGDVSFNNDLFVGLDCSFNGKLFAKFDTSLNSRLVVGSDATINKCLIVSGDASFNGNLFADFDTSLNSRLVVGSDVRINKRLFVLSDASFTANVLIGTVNTRLAPLHIASTLTASTAGTGAKAYFTNGTATALSVATTAVAINPSLFASGSMVTNGYVVASSTTSYSDRRIKTNIIDISDVSALETLRNIEPKRYNYIDIMERGEKPVWGFIAQQVRDTMDYAVTSTTKNIPNLYEVVDVSDGDIINLKTKTTNDLSMTDTPLKIVFYNHKNEEIDRILDTIIDEKTFKLTEPFREEDLSSNKIFAYGQEVDDFCILDKNAIFTLGTAALQEVDSELQEAKQKITNLENIIVSLQSQINTINTRLSNVNIQ